VALGARQDSGRRASRLGAAHAVADGRGHGGHIVRGHQPAERIKRQRLAGAVDVAGHDRKPGGHGLEQRIGQAFPPGGLQIEIRGGQERRDIRPERKPQNRVGRGCILATGGRCEDIGQRAITDPHEAEAAIGGGDRARHPGKDIRRLLRHQPSDRDDQNVIARQAELVAGGFAQLRTAELGRMDQVAHDAHLLTRHAPFGQLPRQRRGDRQKTAVQIRGPAIQPPVPAPAAGAGGARHVHPLQARHAGLARQSGQNATGVQVDDIGAFTAQRQVEAPPTPWSAQDGTGEALMGDPATGQLGEQRPLFEHPGGEAHLTGGERIHQAEQGQLTAGQRAGPNGQKYVPARRDRGAGQRRRGAAGAGRSGVRAPLRNRPAA